MGTNRRTAASPVCVARHEGSIARSCCFGFPVARKNTKAYLEVVNNGQDGFISNTIIKKESLKLVAFVSPVWKEVCGLKDDRQRGSVSREAGQGERGSSPVLGFH